MKPNPGPIPSTAGLRAVLVVAAVAASGAAAAQGQTPVFTVDRVECEWLDVNEFTRLLELELTNAAPGVDLPPLTVELSCDASSVVIIVRDPDWTQQIERAVPTPKIEGPGRERQVALTVAQFAGALWRLREEAEQEAAELEGADEPEQEPEPPPAVSPPTAAEELVWALELGGGIRGRALSSAPLICGYGELSAALWLLDWFGVAALVTAEGVQADREGGSVTAVAIAGGFGPASVLVDAGRFRLEARLLLAGGYTRFEGQADDPSSHQGRSTDGGTAEVRVDLAPALVLGRVQLALVAQGGYALPVTIAVVRNDDDVSFSGWWVGGGLRIGLGLGDH